MKSKKQMLVFILTVCILVFNSIYVEARNHDNVLFNERISNLFGQNIRYNDISLSFEILGKKISIDLWKNNSLVKSQVFDCQIFYKSDNGEMINAYDEKSEAELTLYKSSDSVLAILKNVNCYDICGNVCFGEVDENIRLLLNEYHLYSQFEAAESEEKREHDERAILPDYTIHYQGNKTLYVSGYTLGELSVFHPNNLSNGNSTIVRVKINSKTSNFISYLTNVQNIQNVVSPRVYQVNLNVYGTEAVWNVEPNTYEPINNQTTFTATIPYMYNSEWQSVEVNIVTSVTTVSRTHYASTNNYGKVSWMLRKTYGWPSSDTDGTYSTNKGLSCEVAFQYLGNISSNYTAHFTSSASIKYKYSVLDPYTMTYIDDFYTTSSFSKGTTITILP